MTARVLLVGEANPYGGDPEFALWDQPEGASGDRLRRILGLRPENYRALHRANLCPSIWSLRRARDRAQLIKDRFGEFAEVRVVILLGRKVAEGFRWHVGQKSASFALDAWCTRVTDHLSPTTYVALPHPSGRCLEWNHRDNVLRARGILREIAPSVPWGEAPDCRCPAARCTCETPQMQIVHAAAARFDARPIERASIAARAELDCVYCRTQPDDGPGCPCAHAPCVHDGAR